MGEVGHMRGCSEHVIQPAPGVLGPCSIQEKQTILVDLAKGLQW